MSASTYYCDLRRFSICRGRLATRNPSPLSSFSHYAYAYALMTDIKYSWTFTRYSFQALISTRTSSFHFSFALLFHIETIFSIVSLQQVLIYCMTEEQPGMCATYIFLTLAFSALNMILLLRVRTNKIALSKENQYLLNDSAAERL